jgi:hypothetical protein
MAKVKLGGKEYLISELNFIALEKAWDAIEVFMEDATINPVKACGLAVKVIAAAVQEEPEFDRAQFGITADEVLTPEEQDARIELFFKKQVKGPELPELQVSVMEIMEEAGLMAAEGELLAAMKAMKELKSSMVTSAASLPSSSPPESREEVGAE